MNLSDRPSTLSDEAEIDELADRFFDLFTTTDNRTATIHDIKEMFLTHGTLINNTSGIPEVYDLDAFIRPREELLSNGTLTDFREYEIAHHSEIHGNMALRVSSYEKSGLLNGEAFTGQGKKLMHFVKVQGRWYFASVVWSDI